jgi:hypothetical protein
MDSDPTGWIRSMARSEIPLVRAFPAAEARPGVSAWSGGVEQRIYLRVKARADIRCLDMLDRTISAWILR